MGRSFFIFLVFAHALSSIVFGRCQTICHDHATGVSTNVERVIGHEQIHVGVHGLWLIDDHPYESETTDHLHLIESDASRKAPRVTSVSHDVLITLAFVEPAFWTVLPCAPKRLSADSTITAITPWDPPLSGRTSHLLF